ncbi:Hypothetical predicted protein [Mytilus galloprovincialis]|uniref:Uncharacterized protein n=1 Tax=Mytilus galloprovincialis TaxID=29158 RepID=A0A8B6H4H3_MYTGA|nr:Hypothetical predicted protein [Mytilus galloprovincialis]
MAEDGAVSGKYLMVAAIDFGTSYSGYAYSTREDFETDPNKIIVNNPYNAGAIGLMSLKEPTCILLDEEKKCVAFGYDAENQFVDLASDNKQDSYYFFQRFKMKLHEIISPFMTATEIGGKEIPAIDVFALSIKALMEKVIEVCRKQGADFIKIEDIKWVLTVPAIWSEKAKRFMRQSAEKAGIPEENLLIALEPECASVYCQYLKTEHMIGAEGGFKASSPNSKYMVVDLGGGTADIAVHEKMEGHHLKELCRATGGACGGTSVDDEFLLFLQEIFESEVIKQFKIDDPESFLLLLRSFESAKRKKQPNTTGKVSIHLPYVPLSKLCEDYHQQKVEEVINSSSLHHVVVFKSGHLRIDADYFKSFFNKTLKKLETVMQKVFEDARVQGVENIILVGGFAECELVQKTIRSCFPSKRVIIPYECGLAVLKGAVMYGHKPSYISARVVAFTYGVCVAKPYDKRLHDRNHLTMFNGKEYSKDLFHKTVERETDLEIGTKIVLKFITSQPFQKYIKIKMYLSKSKNPVYVDEDDCSYVGRSILTVNYPTREAQHVSVIFTFGDTEIKIEKAKNDTGDKYEGSLDLLSEDHSDEQLEGDIIPDILLIDN